MKMFVDVLKGVKTRIRNALQNKKLILGIILFVAILCGIYYFLCLITLERRFSSDDAGWIVATYFQQELGIGKTFKEYLSVFYWLQLLEYNIFKGSEYASYANYVLCYVCAVFSAIYLALDGEKKFCWKGLPVLLFMIGIPGNVVEPVIKFHAIPTIVTLYLLLLCQKRVKTEIIWKTKEWIIFIAILAQGFVTIDFLLTVVYIVIPILLGFIVKEYFERKYQKYYVYIYWFVIINVFIFWWKFRQCSFTGYGSYEFPSLEIVWSNLINLINGGLLMFNIPLIGKPILQFQTVIWCLRIGIIIIAIIIMFKYLGQFFRGELRDSKQIDVLLSLIFMCSLVAFLFTIHPGNEESVRYVSILYYIIPIVFCRRVVEWLDKEDGGYSYLITIFFVMCIAMYLQPLKFEKKVMNQDKLVDQLINDERFEWGIGEYWNSHVIDVLSHYQKRIQPWSTTDASVAKSGYPEYMSGYSRYNFFVEDFMSKKGEERKEKILDILGEPLETIQVENSEIYLFDYDIRTKPIYYNAASNRQDIVYSNGVVITEEGFVLEPGAFLEINNLLAYTGEERIEIFGRNVENSLVSLDRMDEVVSLSTEKNETNNKESFTICAIGHYPDLVLRIQNAGEEEMVVTEIASKRVSNAAQAFLDKSNKTIIGEVGKGNYYISLLSDKFTNEKPQFYINDRIIMPDIVSKGRRRIVYHISSDTQGELKVVWDDLPSDIKCFIETPYTEIQNYW